MTYSHNTSQSLSPFTPNPHDLKPVQAGLFTPVVLAAIKVMWFWTCAAARAFEAGRSGETGQQSSPYNAPMFRMAMGVIGILINRLDLPYAEKKAILGKLFCKVMAQQTRKRQLKALRLRAIWARYMTWRQRMCWRWGGAHLGAGLANFSGRRASANEQISFDALIPD